MAVELGLNRYLTTPPPNESEFHMRERRNRERTYLVLWVHDRSLSMQTGRQWMLPEVRFRPSRRMFRYSIIIAVRMISSSSLRRGTRPAGTQFDPRM
jgi:hypothetical protein